MTRPQEHHADLGLVDNDLIRDRRKAPAATEALQKNDHPNTQLKGQP